MSKVYFWGISNLSGCSKTACFHWGILISGGHVSSSVTTQPRTKCKSTSTYEWHLLVDVFTWTACVWFHFVFLSLKESSCYLPLWHCDYIIMIWMIQQLNTQCSAVWGNTREEINVKQQKAEHMSLRDGVTREWTICLVFDVRGVPVSTEDLEKRR